LHSEAVVTLPVRDHINRVLRSSLDESGLPWLPLYEMSDLPRARSYLVTQAVESGAKRVVFLDADIVVSADEIRQLAAHPRVSDVGAVTGLYAMRDGQRWACHAPDERVEPDGCRRAVYAGLGFACISRAALLRVREGLPELRDAKVGSWWPYCVPTLGEAAGGFPEYCADDLSLWRRLAESGTQLWADTRLVAGHVAAITLRGLL
jgi:hypothetical protein